MQFCAQCAMKWLLCQENMSILKYTHPNNQQFAVVCLKQGIFITVPTHCEHLAQNALFPVWPGALWPVDTKEPR